MLVLHKKLREPAVEHIDSAMLAQHLREGNIVKIQSNRFERLLEQVSLASLKENFGDAPIFTHKGKQTLLGNLVQGLQQNPDCGIKTWYEEADYDDPRLDLYGVINLKRLEMLYQTLPFDLFAQWAITQSFLWLGYSTGSLHFDEIDNVLFQVKGTKRILLFPRQYTDVIDGRHRPERVPTLGFLSPSALKTNPWLGAVPHHEIVLNPGEGLVIPAYTYHAPIATSYNSISVNTFLFPHFRSKELIPDLSQFLVPKTNPCTPMFYYLIKAASWWFSQTGRSALKFSLYEFL